MNLSPGVSINRPLKGKAGVFTGFEDALVGVPDYITLSQLKVKTKRYEQNLKKESLYCLILPNTEMFTKDKNIIQTVFFIANEYQNNYTFISTVREKKSNVSTLRFKVSLCFGI